MKRSELNAMIDDAIAFIKQHGVHLPPFAYYTPTDWETVKGDSAEVRDCGLGWDVTDFGSGDFAHRGLLLFTIRNGSHALRDAYPKPYAEKLLIANEGQITPMHFHHVKTEDIINKGGAELELTLYNSTPDGGLCDSDVAVVCDGRRRTVPAGGKIVLSPGESITLTPGLYHSFTGRGGTVLIGEVSSVNDDVNDNRFYEAVSRFSSIDEDAPARYVLCNEWAE